MTKQDAFLANIIEHPDDDAPRLIYAHWLEEHGGDPRQRVSGQRATDVVA